MSYICEVCGKEFFEDWRKDRRVRKNPPRFCCKGCSNTKQHTEETKEKIRQKVIMHNIQKGINRVEKTEKCLCCGKSFAYIYSKNIRERKFCSKQCCRKYKDKFKGIDETGIVGANAKQHGHIQMIAREYLIKKHGHKCMMCGRSTWLGQPIMLIADHIDGNPTNNHISNFRIICPNCDATLPTFKGRNKGHGRVAMGVIKAYKDVK